MDRKEIKQLRILGIIGVVAAFLTILMECLREYLGCLVLNIGNLLGIVTN